MRSVATSLSAHRPPPRLFQHFAASDSRVSGAHRGRVGGGARTTPVSQPARGRFPCSATAKLRSILSQLPLNANVYVRTLGLLPRSV